MSGNVRRFEVILRDDRVFNFDSKDKIEKIVERIHKGYWGIATKDDFIKINLSNAKELRGPIQLVQRQSGEKIEYEKTYHFSDKSMSGELD